jgi:hypothetical protein
MPGPPACCTLDGSQLSCCRAASLQMAQPAAYIASTVSQPLRQPMAETTGACHAVPESLAAPNAAAWTAPTQTCAARPPSCLATAAAPADPAAAISGTTTSWGKALTSRVGLGAGCWQPRHGRPSAASRYLSLQPLLHRVHQLVQIGQQLSLLRRAVCALALCCCCILYRYILLHRTNNIAPQPETSTAAPCVAAASSSHTS